MTRQERVQQRIDLAVENGNVDELLHMAVGGLCGCLGKRDDEEFCVCIMTSKQVRDQVSLFALKKNKILPLGKTQ